MAAERPLLLVVEREPSEVDGIERACALAGFSARTVATVDEGVEELKQRPVDAVLFDLGTPGAAAICGEARQRSGRRRVPVLALDDELDDSTFKRAFRTGADDAVGLAHLDALTRRLAAIPSALVTRPLRPRGDALVVDADKGRAAAIAEVLVGAGFRVEAAHDLETARAGVARSAVALIVVNAAVEGGVPWVRQAAEAGTQAAWVVLERPEGIVDTVQALRGLASLGILSVFGPPEDVLFESNRLLGAANGEGRTEPRLLYGATVRFGAPGQGLGSTGFSYNISASGLYVRTLEPIEAETAELEWRPPGTEELVRLDGKVVWRRAFGPTGTEAAPPGFGVRLSGGAGQDLARYRELFEAAYVATRGESASVVEPGRPEPEAVEPSKKGRRAPPPLRRAAPPSSGAGAEVPLAPDPAAGAAAPSAGAPPAVAPPLRVVGRGASSGAPGEVAPGAVAAAPGKVPMPRVRPSTGETRAEPKAPSAGTGRLGQKVQPPRPPAAASDAAVAAPSVTAPSVAAGAEVGGRKPPPRFAKTMVGNAAPMFPQPAAAPEPAENPESPSAVQRMLAEALEARLSLHSHPPGARPIEVSTVEGADAAGDSAVVVQKLLDGAFEPRPGSPSEAPGSAPVVLSAGDVDDAGPASATLLEAPLGSSMHSQIARLDELEDRMAAASALPDDPLDAARAQVAALDAARAQVAALDAARSQAAGLDTAGLDATLLAVASPVAYLEPGSPASAVPRPATGAPPGGSAAERRPAPPEPLPAVRAARRARLRLVVLGAAAVAGLVVAAVGLTRRQRAPAPGAASGQAVREPTEPVGRPGLGATTGSDVLSGRHAVATVATVAPAPSASASSLGASGSGAGAASAVAPVSAQPAAPTSAAPPTGTATEPDLAQLEPGMGYLFVESSLSTKVFVHGRLAGNTNTWVTARCGPRFIRLGRVLGEWQGEGGMYVVACRKATRMTLP